MIANSRCIACILSKQERKIRKNSDEQKKKEYIHKVLKILYEYGTKECAPMVEKRIKDIYKEYYEEDVDYVALKHRYNQAHIQKNNDIETCIKYVCAGNYIDFGVANKIDDQLLQGLLDKVNELKISKKEVAYLEDELAQAKTLLYITDNCGEIVLDKIFIEELQNKYKNLQITAMVRGGIASNDATMEDAEEIGLTNVVPVIGNGVAIMGTVKEQLSEEAKEKIQNADIIIAKGMGNFESMYQEGMNPYYLLLCKCELYKEILELKCSSQYFVRKKDFDLPQARESVYFAAQTRIQLLCYLPIKNPI